MNLTRLPLFSITPGAFWTWGRIVLGGAFGLLLLILLFLTWQLPSVLPFFPLLLLVGVGAWILFQYPLANLFLVVAGLPAVLDYSEGLQILEVLYGLYILGFLAHWFVTRVYLYQADVCSEPEEKALLLFLIGATASIPLTFLFGGHASWMISEWIALIMLLVYFPVKEALVRHPRAPQVLLAAFLIVGLFVVARNVWMYKQALTDAEHAWQIATGRAYMNDNILMVASVGGLVFLTFARGWRVLLTLGLFTTFFVGLILTQSRAYWVSFALGGLVVFLLVRASDRRRMLLLGMTGLGVCLVFSLIFFGEYVTIIFAGLLDRLASLMTAVTDDVSLVNRFRETAAVWEHIVHNPVLGHGMGVPYAFFDLAHMSTDKDAFVHNGYISVWYKFGLWGLGLVLYFWMRTIGRGVQTIRFARVDPDVRPIVLLATASLIALMLATLTSNPLFLNDSTFTVGVLLGLVGGAYRRTRNSDEHRNRLPSA